MSETNPEPSYSVKLPYTADCVESFPYKFYDANQKSESLCEGNDLEYQIDDFKGRFVLGMYQLKKSESENVRDDRIGQLIVADYFQKPGSKTGNLIKTQTIDTVGVFDIKWSYNLVDGKQLLGQAGSNGKLTLYNTNTNSKDMWLKELTSSDSFGNDGNMCLSLDWSNRAYEQNEVRIACSYSDGNINVFQLDNRGYLSSINSVLAHSFEAWITAFDYHNANTLYSGGDDGLFKRWDIRENSYYTSNFTSKRHNAGVCSIQSNPRKEHILASGSYDEMVFVWDDRNLRSPLLEYHAGGGVWRLKWNQDEPSKLLAAAMHNGVHVLDISGLPGIGSDALSMTPSVELLSYFDKHQSMAYGADWGYSFNERVKNNHIASCSFYDQMCFFWNY